MKYFFVTVTTTYDGYEWLSVDTVQAASQQAAETIVAHTDYTHDNDIEVQELSSIEEISKADFDVLNRYL